MTMTEAERIAIRVLHYDGTPCNCEQCTARRLSAAAGKCPNTLPDAVCVDWNCTYCRIAAEEGVKPCSLE